MGIRVDKEKCVGCSLCVKACPFDAIIVSQGKAVIDESKCSLCKACIEACAKYRAITLSAEQTLHSASGDYKNVAVFIEQYRGTVATVSYEMLGEGRKLADQLGEKLIALLIGDKMHSKTEELIRYGADEVYYFNGTQCEAFRDDTYAAITKKFIEEVKPSVFLGGATAIGRSFIPQVAATVYGGLTADCVQLTIDPGKKLLLGTRPAFGGNLMATIICPMRRPQMVTVRHKVMQKAVFNQQRTGRCFIRDIAEGMIRERTVIVNTVKESGSTINISEADIIVSGGRGMQNPDNFRYLQELARILGGAVGASRAAVDSGWIPYAHQIGQTGKTVSPKLYIACGISGSIQHQAGIGSSDYIIAINKDPHADIFQIANVGIVGNALEILPALIEEFKKMLGREG